jgi:hypothetical protein
VEVNNEISEYFYLIYNKKYRKLLKTLDENNMGLILDFKCPNDHMNMLEDRYAQNIYADGILFFDTSRR